MADPDKFKLIRQRGEDNLVYHMDLSTVDGLEAARTIVQANDIIYVESNPQVVREAWPMCRRWPNW